MTEEMMVKGLRDFLGKNRGGERTVDSECLAHDDDVRLDIPVFDGEKFPSAPHAGHGFIDNEQQVPSITEGSHAFQVAIGRDNDAIAADDRF